MYRVVFSLLLISTTLIATGQKIESASMLGDRKYYQDGRRLRMQQLSNILSENKEASALYNKASTHYTLAQVAGIPGGFLVGWQLGRMLTGNKPNTTGLLVGLALEAIYIPLQHSYNKKSRKAVDLYNNELSEQTKEVGFILNANGIGLSIKL